MKRIQVLDVWRSLCVIIMVAYHGIYDLILFGMADAWLLDNPLARVIEYTTAASFILISGIVARYSHDLLRRGFGIFCLGLIVAVAMTAVGAGVAFGILQFFGVAMMSYYMLKDCLCRLTESWLFAAGCVLLFVLTLLMTQNFSVNVRWLYPIGFTYEGFYSADYFPILPWIFIYFFGVWLGSAVDRHLDAPIFNVSFPPALSFPGRYSLAIYVVHQPLMYGLCFIISR